MLFIETHICKNVKEHALILNTPTSEVVNFNMKRRGKNSVVTVFIIFDKMLSGKIEKKVNSIKCGSRVHG